jgi:hypothetical protein
MMLSGFRPSSSVLKDFASSMSRRSALNDLPRATFNKPARPSDPIQEHRWATLLIIQGHGQSVDRENAETKVLGPMPF